MVAVPSPAGPDRRFGHIAFAAVLVIAALIYATVAHVLPFGDDWHHVGRALSGGYGSVFGEARFFRLWERLVYAVDQDLFSGVAASNRPVAFFAVVISACLLYRVAQRFTPAGSFGALLVASVYVLHPANAASVMQTDTVSQALAVLFSLISIRLLVFSPHGSARWVGAAALLAALLSKETVLGTVCWIPIALYVRRRYLDRDSAAEARRNALTTALVVAGALAAYLAMRFAAATPIVARGTGRYAPQFDPLSMLENAANLLGAAVYVGDAPSLFVFGFTGRAIACIALTCGLLAISGLGFMYWCRRAKEDPADPRALLELLIWLSFGGAAMVPVIAMGQVSEVYVAGITPFAALGYGVLISRWIEGRVARPPVRHAVSIMLIVAIVLSGGMATYRSLELYSQVSARTWSFVQALHPVAPACLEARRTLILEANLADTTSGGRQYGMSSANNERIARRVIDAYANPQIAPWLDRTMRDAAAGEIRLPPSDTNCEARTLEEPTPACKLRCSAGAQRSSALTQCRIREEKCTDSRKLRRTLPMLFPDSGGG